MLGSLVPTIRRKSKGIIAVRIVLLLLIIFNLSFIWVNSAKVSDDSDKSSKTIAENVAKRVVKDYENLTKSQQKSHVSKLNTKIRSMAHFAEFIPLGLLWWLFIFSLFAPKDNRWYLPLLSFALALILSALCALFDEIHQIYVKGRSFELKDIAIDTLGALCGCTLCVLVRDVYRGVHKIKPHEL